MCAVGIHHRRTLPKVPSSAHCYAHVRTHPRSERYAAVKSITLGETPALVEQPPLEPPAAWNPKDCTVLEYCRTITQHAESQKKSRSRHNSALQLKRCVFIFYVLIAKGGEPRQVQELQGRQSLSTSSLSTVPFPQFRGNGTAEMELRKGNLWKGNLREGNCGKGIAEKELWKLKLQAMLPACEGLVRPFKLSQPLQV